jgi:8-hydroxy-5-deazaflavin:NADPH oxidoreductase
MRIGVIGAGNLGTAIAKRLVPKGHEVMLSYSRDAKKLDAAARTFGAKSGSATDAVRFADVVALTVPWGAVKGALSEAGSLSGKILWDCTNALKPDMSGLAIGATTSGGEEVAKMAVGAKVIKGIPPFAEVLHSDNPTVNGQPVGVFIAGEDSQAKSTVASLLAALPATVTDVGGLEAARLIEPAMMLLVRLAYGLNFGPRVALQVSRETVK